VDRPAVRGRDENYKESVSTFTVTVLIERGCRSGVQASYATMDGARRAELRWTWDERNAMGRVMRTFLDALERSIVDCRELKGTNCVGRSPLLGSIVKCRPKFVVELDHSIFFQIPPSLTHREVLASSPPPPPSA
jgi:hypothetical protein